MLDVTVKDEIHGCNRDAVSWPRKVQIACEAPPLSGRPIRGLLVNVPESFRVAISRIAQAHEDQETSQSTGRES